MLRFLDDKAPNILSNLIAYCKEHGVNTVSLFKSDMRVQAMFIISFIADSYKIDTYISKMGLISIKVTYPSDSDYRKEGIVILRKPLCLTNSDDVKEYMIDLISYINHNPY